MNKAMLSSIDVLASHEAYIILLTISATFSMILVFKHILEMAAFEKEHTEFFSSIDDYLKDNRNRLYHGEMNV